MTGSRVTNAARMLDVFMVFDVDEVFSLLSEVDLAVGILDTLLRLRAETPTYIPVVPAVMPIRHRSIERSASLLRICLVPCILVHLQSWVTVPE
jgi:hypothetical protein